MASGAEKKKPSRRKRFGLWCARTARDAPVLVAVVIGVPVVAMVAAWKVGVSMRGAAAAWYVLVLVSIASGTVREFLVSQWRLWRARVGWRSVTDDVGERAPGRVQRVEQTLAGWRYVIVLPRGRVWKDLDADRVASALTGRLRGGPVGRASIERLASSPRFVTVHARTSDPLAEPVMAPPPMVRRVGEPIPVGVDEHGETVTVTLGNPPHLAAGGVPGGGKSTFLHQVIAGFLADPSAVAVLMDGKHVELLAWVESPRVAFVGADPTLALHAVEWVVREMEERYRLLGEAGVRKVSDLPPAKRPCPLLLLVDECTSYYDDDSRGKALKARVTHVMRMCRAAGISVVVATQKPTGEALPTAQRDLAEQRVSFAVTTRSMGEAILGDGYAEAALGVPRERPGRFAAVLGGRVVEGRSFAAPDDWLEDAAALASEPPRGAAADSAARFAAARERLRVEALPPGSRRGPAGDGGSASGEGDGAAVSVTVDAPLSDPPPTGAGSVPGAATVSEPAARPSLPVVAPPAPVAPLSVPGGAPRPSRSRDTSKARAALAAKRAASRAAAAAPAPPSSGSGEVGERGA